MGTLAFGFLSFILALLESGKSSHTCIRECHFLVFFLMILDREFRECNFVLSLIPSVSTKLLTCARRQLPESSLLFIVPAVLKFVCIH